MSNIPNVHEFDRDIPAGKVLIAEYRQIGAAERRVRETILDVKTRYCGTQVRLVARFAGWACAGSMSRWDNGCFGVYWEFDGARHGSGYKTFEQALAHFERIPTIDPYAAYKTA